MKASRLTLGQALAYLKYKRNSGAHLKALNPEDQEYVSLLKNKLKSESPSVRGTQTNLSDVDVLEDHFLSCLLENFSGDASKEECFKLHEQLNDSYPLFKRFTDVMRDFYHASLELSKDFSDKC